MIMKEVNYSRMNVYISRSTEDSVFLVQVVMLSICVKLSFVLCLLVCLYNSIL
jgi:hypothetical protein